MDAYSSQRGQQPYTPDKGKGLVDFKSGKMRSYDILAKAASALRRSVLQGLPFSLIGPGDMLALFRCLSCKYSFSTDVKNLAIMGAPGRVFSSGEVETSDNLQHCNMSIYLRVRDAKACRVSSTVLLPIFADASRKTPVAVLEVTQFSGNNTSYQTVFDWARKYLEAAGLYLPRQMETRTFEMQSHALSIRFFSSRDSALGCIFSSNSYSNLATEGLKTVPSSTELLSGAGSHRPKDLVTTQDAETDKDQGSNPTPRSHESGAHVESPGPETDDDHDSNPRQTSVQGDINWDPKEQPTQKTLLTREDLDKHFAYGLNEAAHRLGVCKTTLKRACRRHGIARWPRRDILKAAKLQQKEAAASLENVKGLAVPSSMSLQWDATPQHMPEMPSQQLNPSRQQAVMSTASVDDLTFLDAQHSRQDIRGVPRCSSQTFPSQLADLSAFPTRHSLPSLTAAEVRRADLRAVRSGEWPNPRLATAARERASNSNQLRTDSPDLNDIRRSSLGGLVDAFFGDGPLSEPRGMSPIPNGDKWDLAAATFKTGDFSFQKEVSAADGKPLSSFAELPETWQMDIDESGRGWDYP